MKINVVRTGTPIVMSTGTKHRMITLEIAEMTTELLMKYGNQLGLQQKTMIWCKTIEKNLANIRQVLFSAPDTSKFILKAKDWYKFDKLRKACLKTILTTEGTAQVIDQIELLNAVMILIAKEKDNLINLMIVVSSQDRLNSLYLEWDRLGKNLMTLYRHMDPDFEEESRIRLGHALANKLTDLIDNKTIRRYAA